MSFKVSRYSNAAQWLCDMVVPQTSHIRVHNEMEAPAARKVRRFKRRKARNNKRSSRDDHKQQQITHDLINQPEADWYDADEWIARYQYDQCMTNAGLDDHVPDLSSGEDDDDPYLKYKYLDSYDYDTLLDETIHLEFFEREEYAGRNDCMGMTYW